MTMLEQRKIGHIAAQAVPMEGGYGQGLSVVHNGRKDNREAGACQTFCAQNRVGENRRFTLVLRRIFTPAPRALSRV